MILLQITGDRGGDTILLCAPVTYTSADLREVLRDLNERTLIEFFGDPMVEKAMKLPEALPVDHYSVFVQVD